MDAITISQIINELGEDRERYFNAVVPPVFQTSNFTFNTVGQFRDALLDESAHYLYSRGNNPTLDIIERKLAALSHAEDSLVVNSGAGAVFISVLANLKSGDHIVSVENPYTWAKKMFENVLPRFNVSTTFVDGRDIKNFEKAIQPNTSLIYLESPNSWTFYLQDLRAIASLAKTRNIITICDNSYATPLYQRPLDMGIDIAIQSATKYLNGHSDVVAGVICGSKQIINKIFNSEYLNLGIGATPFNAWLILRGLRTLPARMETVSKSAAKVVAFLHSRDEVESVSWPFDTQFPQYDLAKTQMSGAGGLLSFLLRTKSAASIESFCNALKHILMAVSWGGYESLIMPGVAGLNEGSFDPENDAHRRLRLYVGLEDVEYLIDDLKRGFDAMKA